MPGVPGAGEHVTNWYGKSLSSAIGGLLGGQGMLNQTYNPSQMQSFGTQQHISSSSSSTLGQFNQWGAAGFKKIHHDPKTADSFKSLTAYIRAVLSCEPNCECKWCGANELERQMALAQFFRPEDEQEGANGVGGGAEQAAEPAAEPALVS